MNAIQDVIGLLTDNEKDDFVRYLKSKNKRHDTKNIQLFNLLKTDDINDQKKITDNKPALYALRKRLHENLIAFLADRRFETDASDEHAILKLLLLSRTFFEHSQVRIAFKTLKKAEEKAVKLERYNLLNEIYHTHIQYAYLDTTLPFADLIQKYQVNQEKFLLEEKLNLGYASLRLELIKTKEGTNSFDFQRTVTETMVRYGISSDEILTFKSLYQILYLVNEYAGLRNNYFEVNRFVDQSYHFIVQKKELAERHLYYHIQILYFMANMLFRNKRFSEARGFLEKMDVEMRKQEKMYYRQFYNKWVALQSLNENYSGHAKEASVLLHQALAKIKGAEIAELHDLHLTLAVINFQQQDIKNVQQQLKAFSHSDAWYEKREGMEWTLKKNLMEILLHAELGHFDYALSRITSFKRRYKTYLTESKEERVLVFLSFVEKYLFEPGCVASQAFKDKLEQSFAWKAHREEDVFAMSFYAWLKAKMEKRNIYEVTLELVKKILV